MSEIINGINGFNKANEIFVKLLNVVSFRKIEKAGVE